MTCGSRSVYVATAPHGCIVHNIYNKGLHTGHNTTCPTKTSKSKNFETKWSDIFTNHTKSTSLHTQNYLLKYKIHKS